MGNITSKDGTPIAFDKSGTGSPVVLVGGVLGDRSQQAPLAALLAEHFTVYNYDRRGHGESGFTAPYAVEREIEDLAAIINEAGGSACVYGTSGCGVLSVLAAAHGVPMKKLAVWETPYIIDNSRPPMPSDYQAQLEAMLASGRRGDMIELFMTEAADVPAPFVAQMRAAPWWPAQEALAPTLVYDAQMMGDYSLPIKEVASIKIPALVLDGGQSSWLSHACNVLAKTLPNATRRTLTGQPHNVDAAAVAPALADFFAA